MAETLTVSPIAAAVRSCWAWTPQAKCRTGTRRKTPRMRWAACCAFAAPVRTEWQVQESQTATQYSCAERSDEPARTGGWHPGAACREPSVGRRRSRQDDGDSTGRRFRACRKCLAPTAMTWKTRSSTPTWNVYNVAARASVLPKDRLLQQIGALTDEGKPTVSGLLLGKVILSYSCRTAKDIRQVLRHAATRAGGRSAMAGEEFTGPLPRIIDRAWRVIWEEMDKQAVVKGLHRQEQTEYLVVGARGVGQRGGASRLQVDRPQHRGAHVHRPTWRQIQPRRASRAHHVG